jgi:hypothetical protein
MPVHYQLKQDTDSFIIMGIHSSFSCADVAFIILIFYRSKLQEIYVDSIIILENLNRKCGIHYPYLR